MHIYMFFHCRSKNIINIINDKKDMGVGMSAVTMVKTLLLCCVLIFRWAASAVCMSGTT